MPSSGHGGNYDQFKWLAREKELNGKNRSEIRIPVSRNFDTVHLSIGWNLNDQESSGI